MLNPRLDLLSDYPFQRLTDLLGGPATPDSIVMSIGEPQHQAPPMVAEILARHAHEWGKYPPANGTPDFRQAVANWLIRRFKLNQGLITADRHILPVAGTREALYMIAEVACGPSTPDQHSAVLLPNPFYQVYAGAALMAGAEPIFVPGTGNTTAQPDYTRLPEAVLRRTKLAYLCSPANPQGSVANLDLLKRTIDLARRFDFILAVDECYSEIWDQHETSGALSAAGDRLDNLVVFNSLSKRSSVPGLRSGFVAGDERIIKAFARLRSYGGAAVPLPILAASTALWNDEEHVDHNRLLYRQKLDLAQRHLGHRPGFHRPEGGFFLWLDVGDGEAATLELWRQAKIRVLPGAYLAKTDQTGFNPGKNYVRIALVHDLETCDRALNTIATLLA